jgi:peptide/nickel transport system permease protein
MKSLPGNLIDSALGAALAALVAASAPASAQPSAAQVVVSQSSDALTLDPSLSTDPISLNVFKNVYDQLTDIAAYGSVAPLLATSWIGFSLRQHAPALSLVLERVPATLELALSSFILGIVLASGLGLAMRLSRSNHLRAGIMWLALARQAIPVFSFGLLLILIFSVWLRWLPSLGRGGINHLILPALTLGTYELALYLRLFNAALGVEETQDYVRTAYAKGQARRQVILRHMLPNALLPLVTFAGINLGLLLGGTVVTETVFSWPGVGRLIVQSVNQRDFPVIIAGVFIISLIFVAVNLVVDILYGFLDPRVSVA